MSDTTPNIKIPNFGGNALCKEIFADLVVLKNEGKCFMEHHEIEGICKALSHLTGDGYVSKISIGLCEGGVYTGAKVFQLDGPSRGNWVCRVVSYKKNPKGHDPFNIYIQFSEKWEKKMDPESKSSHTNWDAYIAERGLPLNRYQTYRIEEALTDIKAIFAAEVEAERPDVNNTWGYPPNIVQDTARDFREIAVSNAYIKSKEFTRAKRTLVRLAAKGVENNPAAEDAAERVMRAHHDFLAASSFLRLCTLIGEVYAHEQMQKADEQMNNLPPSQPENGSEMTDGDVRAANWQAEQEAQAAAESQDSDPLSLAAQEAESLADADKSPRMSREEKAERRAKERKWHNQLIEAGDFGIHAFLKENPHFGEFMDKHNLVYSVGYDCQDWVAKVYPASHNPLIAVVKADGDAPYAAITKAIRTSWEVHTAPKDKRHGKHQVHNDICPPSHFDAPARADSGSSGDVEGIQDDTLRGGEMSDKKYIVEIHRKRQHLLFLSAALYACAPMPHSKDDGFVDIQDKRRFSFHGRPELSQKFTHDEAKQHAHNIYTSPVMEMIGGHEIVIREEGGEGYVYHTPHHDGDDR